MELRRSSIHGLGAFALTDIPRGTRIIEYLGEKIGNREADRRYDDAAMKRHHTFLFILNDRTCVDAAFEGNESRFLNHSCAPNCEAVITRGHIWLEARKRISAGTELVYDYQFENDPEYTVEDLRFYACTCGAPTCRGTIVKTRRKLGR
jgi:SET domain-containing protein